MNHTKNYGLPQWELNALIRMEDFNQMCANIEGGVTSAAADAKEAKETAETARRTAVAAYSPANKPYAVGSYRGNGQELVVELGFRPSFVIISGTSYTFTIDSVDLARYNLFSAGNVLSRFISFTDTGFVVRKVPDSDYPKMLENRPYDYIAFR